MTLSCKRSDVILIDMVMYGRDSDWFPCENEDQSKAVVKKNCQGLHNCTFQVKDKMFKDTCWFSGERLKVVFKCGTGKIHTSCNDLKISLPFSPYSIIYSSPQYIIV